MYLSKNDIKIESGFDSCLKRVFGELKNQINKLYVAGFNNHCGSTEKVSRTNSEKDTLQAAVHEMYKSLHPVTGEDLVNLCDNYSGTRLFSQLRKTIPVILPNSATEM